MQKVMIKPLSVNEAWQGKRFKTPKYNTYERELLLKLKPILIPLAPFKVCYEFGLSNVMSDWDNCIKAAQDILQKKYGFNDKDIFEANVKKVKVKKGEEYFAFKIENLFDNALKL